MPPYHREAICAACRDIFGVEVHPDAIGRTAGMTDTAILIRLLGESGVPAPAVRQLLPALYTVAADAYDRLVADDLSAFHTPHAAETLRWLSARGVALGLVTGNIQRIAWRKLRAAGLDEPFRCGAFGDEAESRDDLPPMALARARRIFGRAFPPEEVYVVGDTPADIACGAHSRLRTIGVATGPEHTVEHLRACHPDFLIEDLRGLEALALWGQSKQDREEIAD
jgi:phosphoglycolate phosphatase